LHKNNETQHYIASPIAAAQSTAALNIRAVTASLPQSP